MLRWFRKYNKFILVVGCAVLMVAFLVPQALQQFSPTPGDRVVASVDGEDVKGDEMQQAGIRLEILARLGLGGLVPYEREQWFLLLRDADAAGIGASDVEVTQALAGMGIDPAGDQLAELADRFGQQPEALREVVRDLLIAERYRLLASGHRFDSSAATLSSSPGVVSISMLVEAQRFMSSEQAQAFGASFQRRMEFRLRNALEGTGRLSPPFVTSVLFDEAKRVGGALAVIEPEVTEEIRSSVSEQDIQRLFHEYAEFLPGQGAPHPFGYRVPDRVKLETLSVDSAAVRQTLRVGTVDVLEAFRAENPGQTPTDEQREATRNELLDDALTSKMREIGSVIRGELEAARRGVPTDAAGRLKLEGSSYDPPTLEQLADAVEAAASVRPTLRRYTDEFLPVDEAATLEHLSFAGIPDLGLIFGGLLTELPELQEPRPAPRSESPAKTEGDSEMAEGDADDSPMAEMAEKMDEMDEMAEAAELEEEFNLSPVSVQVGVAMPLLTGFLDNNLHVVRVTAADRTHQPASVDLVRETVTADAARLKAYEALLARQQEVLAEAVSSGLESLPAAGTVIEVPPFPRRTRRDTPDGRPAPPALPELGRAAALVDAAFGAVQQLPAEATVEALAPDARHVAAGVDSTLSLGIFRIDTLERPTRSDLGREVRSGELTGLDRVLLTEGDRDPISDAALRERLNFSDDG